MLDNCQKIFKIRFQSKSRSWGRNAPKEGMKEMKDWNDEQKKAIIDINDLKQLTEKRGFPLSERKNQKVSINPEYYINKKNIENLSPEIVAGSFKN